MPDFIGAVLQAVHLPHVPQQRDGQRRPPNTGQREGNLCSLHRAPAKRAGKDEHNPDHKGDTAADIAPGIPGCGNLVKPVVGGNVGQHRVIKDVARRVPQPRGNEKPQVCHRAAGQAQPRHAEQPKGKRAAEQLFLHAAVVGERPQHGGQRRKKQHRRRRHRRPKPGSVYGVNPLSFRKPPEQNRDGRRHQQDKSGIADIIQHPAAFWSGHFPAHGSASLSMVVRVRIPVFI